MQKFNFKIFMNSFLFTQINKTLLLIRFQFGRDEDETK